MAGYEAMSIHFLLLTFLLCAASPRPATPYHPCPVKHGDEETREILTHESPPGLNRVSIMRKAHAPWVVSIQNTKYDRALHFCGGVIISTDWVLTTAHCVFGTQRSNLQVVAGEYNLFTMDYTEEYLMVFKKIIHPNYEDFSRTNDIALLKVTPSIIYNLFVEPVKFYHDQPSYVNETCKIYGWGSRAVQGSSWSVLDEANQTVLSKKQCLHHYPNLITEGMICAANGNTGPCEGDWGGPLVCRENELCGLASWNPTCGNANYPSVYTNTSYHYDWVQSIITMNDKTNKPEHV